MRPLRTLGPALVLAVLGIACGDDEAASTGDATDAVSDTGFDTEAGADIAEDTIPDASPDAGIDDADVVGDTVADDPDDADTVSDTGADGGTIDGRPVSPFLGRVVINEVLIDGTAEGDPNGDGDTGHPFEDQFIELVNVDGDALDLSGFTLIEEDFADANPRHTFAEGFELAAGHAVVVFGGGDAPEALETASFQTANAEDPPGLSFGLHLSTPADDVVLLDPDGGVAARFCYGATSGECALPAASDTSLTRSPDLTGDFTSHVDAPGSDGAAFSPGTRLDGALF